MIRSRFLRDFLLTSSLAVVYFVGGKLGLKLALVHPSATAVWPCTGIALTAFLIFGYRVWPGILVGAFLANVTTAGSVATSLGIAIGNTLEGVVACYLVSRFAGGQLAFQRAQDVFKFGFLAGMVSTVVSATIGVTTLALGGYASWSMYASMWCTWWLGDGAGAVVVTPLLLLWREHPRLDWTRDQIAELVLLLLGLFFTGWVVFGGGFQAQLKNYPLEYLCLPFPVWAAFRFGRRKAATAICLLTAIATWGTLHGFGPFSRDSQNTSLLLLQVRHLAVSDPLTGLANYRRLLEALDSEVKRCGRTERPFAVLLLDLDALKKINDTHGHLVGSRALCRLANVLRVHCREIDTAARYGGDEFVLLLPETESSAARTVAQRISDRLARDAEEPPISVSIGIAMFPQDGNTLADLFEAADRALYTEKRNPAKNVPLPT
jgi:diguanylate cyclase (GGDEF)-like protein